MRAATLILVAVALLSQSACAVKRVHTAGTDSTARPLLSPASLGTSVSANQILRAAFGERDVTLNSVVAVTPQQVTIVGVTAMGLRAFTVKYDGKQFSAEAAAAVPELLSPERLLNDVQLVYWPLPELQKMFTGSAWSVTEPAPGTRRLRRGDRLVEEVHYTSADAWAGRSWLVNLEHGYTLNIDSQRAAQH